MKTIISIALFLVLNTGLAPSSPATAGPNKNSWKSSANKQAPARTGAQWSADPERGWLPIDERRKSSDPEPVGAGRHGNKQKSKDKASKS